MTNTPDEPMTTRLSEGDIVRLGPTAREKHYVLSAPLGDYVRVRQCSTGKIREVRVDRCVRVSR